MQQNRNLRFPELNLLSDLMFLRIAVLLPEKGDKEKDFQDLLYQAASRY